MSRNLKNERLYYTSPEINHSIIVFRNNIKVDVKVKCIEKGKTQAELAEEIDTTKTYVNRMIKKNWSVVKNHKQRIFE